MRYIAELERKVQTLQTEATTLSAQLTMLQVCDRHITKLMISLYISIYACVYMYIFQCFIHVIKLEVWSAFLQFTNDLRNLLFNCYVYKSSIESSSDDFLFGNVFFQISIFMTCLLIVVRNFFKLQLLEVLNWLLNFHENSSSEHKNMHSPSQIMFSYAWISIWLEHPWITRFFVITVQLLLSHPIHIGSSSISIPRSFLE